MGMLVLALGGCATASPIASPAASPSAFIVVASPQQSPSPNATPSGPPLPPLVGQWQLLRTCAPIVAALTRAHRTDLIPHDVTELLEGVPENGPLPKTWNRAHPCASAKPPTAHSHTFWADGTFNSYNENGQQVDDGTYVIVDDHTLRIGDWTFHYLVRLTRSCWIPWSLRTARAASASTSSVGRFPSRFPDSIGLA